MAARGPVPENRNEQGLHMAHFFIDRPIFAWVIAILIMLSGILAINTLPVAQYPNIAPPEISITAIYPGASAKTIEDTVVQVIEQKLKGIDNLEYMYSNSSSSEPVTITALSTWAVSDIRPEKDKTLVGQWLEEQLNMDLELVTIPGEAVTTKVNAMAATGELPTILFKVGDNTAISETNKQGNKGLFLNVMDYLDKVPNYAKYLEDDFIRREMSDVDGNVYGFAKIYTDGSIMYTTPIIR